MEKQFVAMIPARKLGTFAYPARQDTYSCDDDGQWYGTRCGEIVKLDDADVIDACKAATNWSEIWAAYFPMYGFHAPDGDWDNTHSHKQDF